ncbi:helix-turn-helix domain-containing protein [Serratia marcescens]|nr:helix-turn-helix domain-containing protein [Serratia marcescens]
MKNFLPIDRDFLSRTDLNSNMKLIYAYLANFEFSCGKGNVFPSMEKISVDLGISVCTVKRQIKELVNIGLLSAVRKSRRESNNYSINPAITETAAVTTEAPTIEEIANDSPDNANPDLPAPISEPESRDEPTVQQTDNDHSDRVGSDCGGLTAFPVEGWVKLSRNVWKSLKGRKIAGSKKGEGDTDARAYVINRLQHFSGPYEPVFNQWMREENLSF